MCTVVFNYLLLFSIKSVINKHLFVLGAPQNIIIKTRMEHFFQCAVPQSLIPIITGLLKQRRKRWENKNRDDLYPLGRAEAHGYPSLSGRKGRQQERRGLDEGVRSAQGEGPNGVSNHILHLTAYSGCIYAYMCAKQMWGSEGKSGTCVHTEQSLCEQNCGSMESLCGNCSCSRICVFAVWAGDVVRTRNGQEIMRKRVARSFAWQLPLQKQI